MLSILHLQLCNDLMQCSTRCWKLPITQNSSPISTPPQDTGMTSYPGRVLTNRVTACHRRSANESRAEAGNQEVEERKEADGRRLQLQQWRCWGPTVAESSAEGCIWWRGCVWWTWRAKLHPVSSLSGSMCCMGDTERGRKVWEKIHPRVGTKHIMKLLAPTPTLFLCVLCLLR